MYANKCIKAGRQTLSVAFLLFLALFGQNSQATVDSVFIQSRLDYNAILISGVDIVFLYDESLMDSLPKTKSAWYSGKAEFLERAGEGAEVVSVFIPQGFDSEMVSLPERKNEAEKVLIFGEHDVSSRAPVDVTDFSDVLVEIDQFSLLISQRN